MSATVQPIRRPSDWRYARLEGWIVDVPANRVQRGGEDVRLTPKAMAVLRELMQRQGAVVRRDDLLGIVWRDGFPTDDVLTHAVTELRRALEVDPRAPRIIETIPKVGYRLVPSVELLDQLPEEAPVAEPHREGDPPQRPLALFVALGVFVLMCVLIPLLRMPAIDRVSSTPTPLQQLEPFAVTADPTREQFPSVSPDGSTVAYAAMAPDRPATRIMLKSLDFAAVPVPLTSGEEGSDDQPVWSPDGKKIAFLRMGKGECGIQVMPALGGQARRVGFCSSRTLDYLDWSADGKSLLVSRRRASGGSDEARAATVHRLEIETGAEQPVDYAPLPQGEDDLQPRASPDGRWIAFRRGAVPYSDLWVMPAEGGQARRITRLRSRMRGFAWYPDSLALVVSSDHASRQALYRIALDGSEPYALGAEQAVFPAVARNAPVVVYQQESPLLQLAAYRLDTADGVPERRVLPPSTRSDLSPMLSPDAERLAFVSLRSGDPQLWIHEFDAGNTYPVTRLQRTDIGFPRWSPDGRSVLFVARGNGTSTLMRVDVGSGRIEKLTRDDERVRFGSVSTDGWTIFYSSDRSGTWQVWRMSAKGGDAVQVGHDGGFDPRQLGDEAALYYAKETDRGLFRLDLGTGEERRVSWHAGFWNMDTVNLVGDWLYFIDDSAANGDPWLVRAPLHREGVGDASAAEKPEHVARIALAGIGGEMSLSADLKRLVTVSVERDETDLMAAALP